MGFNLYTSYQSSRKQKDTRQQNSTEFLMLEEIKGSITFFFATHQILHESWYLRDHSYGLQMVFQLLNESHSLSQQLHYIPVAKNEF